MKKALSIFLSLVTALTALLPFTAFAADDYFFGDNDDGTAYIMYYAGSDTSLYLPSTTTDGKNVTAIGEGSFQYSSVVLVTVPSGIKTIRDSAFDSSDLTSVNLKEGLETIESHAFGNCSSLTAIAIPASVTTIGEEFITAGSHLQSVTVAEGNTAYTADGTALYDIGKTKILVYAAFNKADSFTLPSTLTTICGYSISMATNLKTLGIPASVTTIKDYAFVGTNNLTDIWYGGTEEQWKAVDKGTENPILSKVTMHYGELPPCATHTWNEGEETTPPTCVDKGVMTYTCTVCGRTKEEPIDATGVHTWNDGEETTPPTCVAEGVMTYTCTTCNATRTEPIDPTGVHTWNDGEETTPPTCVAEGVKTYTCTVCKATKTEPIDPTGVHTWNDGEVTTPPTCVAEGVKTYTCTVCKATKTEPIDPTGVHTWNEGEVTTPPTCEKDGVKTYTCTVCKATKTEPIPAEGKHTWNDGKVTTEPTCVKEGVKTYTCTACGETKTEAVPATGKHQKVIDKAVPATFKKAGKTKGTHCAVCGKVLKAQKKVAKLGKPAITKLKLSKKGLTVKWKKPSRIHGYRIQVSTSKKFTKKTTKTFTEKNQKKASRIIKRYKKGTYYVRIRAYKVINGKKLYSKWSKYKKIKK